MTTPITGRGIGYVKAPRRRQILLFGNFTIWPSEVERMLLAGRVVDFTEKPERPFIEVTNPWWHTRKIPETITTVIARMPDGVHYVLHSPIFSVVDDKTIRFEGEFCEGVYL